MTLAERLHRKEAESAQILASLRRLEQQKAGVVQQITAHEIEAIRCDGEARLLKELLAEVKTDG